MLLPAQVDGLDARRGAAASTALRRRRLAGLTALTEALELRAGRTVLALGAADESLCRELSESGARLVVADPAPDARAALAPLVPSAEIIDGVPGDIPMPQWGADVIITSQPELWLATADAANELHRILSPSGLLAARPRARSSSVPAAGFVLQSDTAELIVWQKA